MEISLLIDGKPCHQKRHRHGRGRTYDPSKPEKNNVIKKIKSQYRGALIDVPITLIITAYYVPPKSYKMNVRSGLHYKQTTPDCDNIAKFYMDAMNKVVYADDKLVASLSVTKMYHERDHVIIYISTLE